MYGGPVSNPGSMNGLQLVYALLLSGLALGSAPNGPWDAFNFAPDSRTVWPRSVNRAVGSVRGAGNLLTKTGIATLSGSQSYLTLDFGVEVRFCVYFSIWF